MSPALAGALTIVTELVDALELAKSEVPDIAHEGLVFARAEAMVVRRRLANIIKAVGDSTS